MQSLPTPAERPWDKTGKGNWINPRSLAPPVEQVGATLEGPPAGRAASLLRDLATIPFASQSGCLLHFQQQHELQEHTKTRLAKKKQSWWKSLPTIYLQKSCTSLIDTHRQRRRTDTDLQASELHSCNALLQASSSYPPERTIFLALFFFSSRSRHPFVFTENHPSAAACGSAES